MQSKAVYTMIYYCGHCSYKSKISWIVLSHMNQNHTNFEKKQEKKAINMLNEIDEKDEMKLKEEDMRVFELCKLLQKMKIYDN